MYRNYDKIDCRACAQFWYNTARALLDTNNNWQGAQRALYFARMWIARAEQAPSDNRTTAII